MLRDDCREGRDKRDDFCATFSGERERFGNWVSGSVSKWVSGLYTFDV